MDLYKEFLGFLTAEQANNIDMFRDYFLYGCASDLIKKIEVSSQMYSMNTFWPYLFLAQSCQGEPLQSQIQKI